MSETEIRNLLEKVSSPERFGDYFLTHGTEDFIFIRPSGNPLDAQGFSDMFNSGDVIIHESKLIKVERLNIYDDVATALCTLKANFSYKGVENEDTYAATAVLKKVGGEWKFQSFQRSSGTTDLTMWS
ncbi:MAG TPA: DUF3804 family protein [Marinobacterium sp.]|nr:DUF3804 family protein [Marinobacterium sp.]